MKKLIIILVAISSICFGDEHLQKKGAQHFLPKIQKIWNENDVDAFVHLHSTESKLRRMWDDEKSRATIKAEFEEMINTIGKIQKTEIGPYIKSNDVYVFYNTYEHEGEVAGTISTIKTENQLYILDWDFDGSGEPELKMNTSDESDAHELVSDYYKGIGLNDALASYLKALELGNHRYTTERMDPQLFKSNEEKEKLIKMLEEAGDTMQFSNITHDNPHEVFTDERAIHHLLGYHADLKVGKNVSAYHSTILATYVKETKEWYFTDVGGKDWRQMRLFYPSFPEAPLDQKFEEK